ncbi:hypothetical protein SmJEL517_g05917 [Synchytrium microbalum]|uniref:PLOD1-3-like GT domain-containing protein n=1 Tax=Synchytrium microbalum TaxID=1806994 RepID=A0A507BU00_9FUNG|nr:uncharacterized protein SmJEL517_g05917 [Synchytrium microbalum]TPX30529.1 hypothetical protein SmJEL517_g05917 [Synchytrium microbalum]
MTFLFVDSSIVTNIKMRIVPEYYFSCLAPPLGGMFGFRRAAERVECSQRVVDSIVDMEAMEFVGLGQACFFESLPFTYGIDCQAAGPNGRDSEACKPEWLTYSTVCSESLNQLADHVHDAGMRFRVFGINTRWRGFGVRIRLAGSYARLQPHNKLLIVSDADDVVLLPTPHCSSAHITSRFINTSTPILFMAERGLWPEVWLSRDFEVKSTSNTSPYKYLNAGTYIGYAWAVADLAERVHRGDCTDDQKSFIHAYLDDVGFVSEGLNRRSMYDKWDFREGVQPEGFQKYIRLDVDNELTNSLFQESMSDFDFTYVNTKGLVVNTHTGGRPCIFHQNGDKSRQILPQFRTKVGA